MLRCSVYRSCDGFVGGLVAVDGGDAEPGGLFELFSSAFLSPLPSPSWDAPLSFFFDSLFFCRSSHSCFTLAISSGLSPIFAPPAPMPSLAWPT